MYSGKKAQHDFPKMRGGGLKAVWNFSKNSSLLEMPSFPNSYLDTPLCPSQKSGSLEIRGLKSCLRMYVQTATEPAF